MIEASEGGLLVIELEDYRALAALFAEAVYLLCEAEFYVRGVDGKPIEETVSIRRFLATQDVQLKTEDTYE